MNSCIQEDFLIERSGLVFVFVFVFLCVFVIVTLDRKKTADNVADWPWCAVYITMVGYRYSCINPT